MKLWKKLAPIAMIYASDVEKAIYYSEKSSKTTHGAVEYVDACSVFEEILVKALQGMDKQVILLGDHFEKITPEKIIAIARGEYQTKTAADIQGTGYVVNKAH